MNHKAQVVQLLIMLVLYKPHFMDLLANNTHITLDVGSIKLRDVCIHNPLPNIPKFEEF